jgi:ATP-dependent RNA helicase DDX24/MAK5
MIEQGHFQELNDILRLTIRTPKLAYIYHVVSHADQRRFDQNELTEGMELPSIDMEDEPREDLQTFIVSATLSKDLQKNLKKSRWKRSKTSSTTLGVSIDILGL